MKEKLPKVFANKISKKISNNDSVFYGKTEEIRTSKKERNYTESIINKINKIFKSPKYVYKVDVEIETKEGKNSYKIIGKNTYNLITIENKLIPIADIIDIREL